MKRKVKKTVKNSKFLTKKTLSLFSRFGKQTCWSFNLVTVQRKIRRFSLGNSHEIKNFVTKENLKKVEIC